MLPLTYKERNIYSTSAQEMIKQVEELIKQKVQLALSLVAAESSEAATLASIPST